MIKQQGSSLHGDVAHPPRRRLAFDN